ncbi:hypothetical protein D1872_37730 [compost metagenome]
MANQQPQRNQSHTQGANITQLSETAIDIKPVGVTFGVTDGMVVDFVTSYLREKGINSLFATVAISERAGKQSPRLVFSAIFNIDGREIFTDNADLNIAPFLRNQMDSSNLQANKSLYDAMRALVGDRFKLQRIDNKRCGITLDVFRVLGLMLGASQRSHELHVVQVEPTGGNHFIAYVMKKQKYVSAVSSNSTDDLAEIALRLNRNQR